MDRAPNHGRGQLSPARQQTLATRETGQAPASAGARPRRSRQPSSRAPPRCPFAAHAVASRDVPGPLRCWEGPAFRPSPSSITEYFAIAVSNLILLAASSLGGALGGPVDQDYLLEARQMQALSFAVHIPLVCFGIAFPAMVLFVEGLYLRTGDPLYKALAKRWSKVMLILFAIGVVTGTILSFELGLLWPEFMANFGDVFGFAFALEAIAFFVEAIFIAIYVYGWARLAARTHF